MQTQASSLYFTNQFDHFVQQFLYIFLVSGSLTNIAIRSHHI